MCSQSLTSSSVFFEIKAPDFPAVPCNVIKASSKPTRLFRFLVPSPFCVIPLQAATLCAPQSNVNCLCRRMQTHSAAPKTTRTSGKEKLMSRRLHWFTTSRQKRLRRVWMEEKDAAFSEHYQESLLRYLQTNKQTLQFRVHWGGSHLNPIPVWKMKTILNDGSEQTPSAHLLQCSELLKSMTSNRPKADVWTSTNITEFGRSGQFKRLGPRLKESDEEKRRLPARRWCLSCFPGSLLSFQTTGA